MILRPTLTAAASAILIALPRTHSFAPSSITSINSFTKSLLSDINDNETPESIFDQFTSFLIQHQSSMIQEIESIDGSGESFSRDGWGAFEDPSNTDATNKSGGITRVIQNGDVVEKGACSLTVIRGGKLTEERARTISGRQSGEDGLMVKEGDVYSAAALSVVLHTRNPFVPVSYDMIFIDFMLGMFLYLVQLKLCC